MDQNFTQKYRPLIVLIEFYQKYIALFLGGQCRFYPSCSEYAKAALQQFGVVRGVVLTLKRLLRCHPLCKGGYDPV